MKPVVPLRGPSKPSESAEGPQTRAPEASKNAPQSREKVLRQFQAAMALMSIIPLLGFVYLVGSVAGLDVFVKSWGILALSIICVSLTGMVLARILVANVVKQLEAANRELVNASEMKSAFLRNVAHEAASPLATARGNLEAIRDDFYGPVTEEVRRPLAVSLRQVERLMRMVTDLLDIAKIEKGVFPMRWARTDLNVVLREAAEAVGQAGQDAPAHLKVSAGGPGRWLDQADRDRLVQVIVNLLRNAQKYGPSDGEILLDVRDAGAFYEVRVSDRGDGIPSAMKDKIFQPFMRHTQRKVAGVGLGLAISKHIVTLHGGRIWAESRPGGGSVFVLQLPMHHT